MSGISVQELVTDFTKENAEKFMEQEIMIQGRDPKDGYSILVNSVKGTPKFSRTVVVDKLDEWGLDEKFKNHTKTKNIQHRKYKKLTKKRFANRIYNRMTNRERKSIGMDSKEFADVFTQLFESRKS